MGFSIVQHVIGADGSGTSQTTWTFTVSAMTAGNLVCGAFTYSGSGAALTPTIVDNASSQNTYSIPSGCNVFDTANGNGILGFQKVGINGGGTTFTVTFPSAVSFFRGEMLEVSGGSAGLDASTSQLQTSITTGISSGNITPSASGDFLYGYSFLSTGGISGWATAGSGFTLENDGANGETIGIADEQQTYNSVAAVAATFSSTAPSSNYITGIIAFKAATSAGCPHNLLTLGAGCGIWAAKKIQENPRVTRRDLIVPRRSLLIPRCNPVTRRGLYMPRKAA